MMNYKVILIRKYSEVIIPYINLKIAKTDIEIKIIQQNSIAIFSALFFAVKG